MSASTGRRRLKTYIGRRGPSGPEVLVVTRTGSRPLKQLVHHSWELTAAQIRAWVARTVSSANPDTPAAQIADNAERRADEGMAHAIGLSDAGTPGEVPW